MDGVAVRRMARQKARRRRARQRNIVAAVTVAITFTAFMLAAGAAPESQTKDPSHGIEPEVITHTVESAPLVTAKPEMQTPAPELPYTEEEVWMLAQTVYGEAMITNSDMEMAAVAWCVLNRVDNPVFKVSTIAEAVTAPSQFHGYSEDHPVDEHIEWLVRDVLNRWVAEKNGAENVGRVLPADYLYFWGDGWHNHFTKEYHGDEKWDWSLPNPYDS